MILDSSNYDPRPDYLRDLISRASLTQRKVACILGVDERTLRNYLNDNHPSKAPYSVQFCLEYLVKNN